MKKRIFAFVLCLLTCLTFSAIAFATENPIEPTDLCVYEGDVQPRINTACPFGNGIHQMASRGAGFVAMMRHSNMNCIGSHVGNVQIAIW